MENKFKKGNTICSSHCPGVFRRIVKALDGYYLWEYPDIRASDRNKFDSRNSNDPGLTHWELYTGPLKEDHAK